MLRMIFSHTYRVPVMEIPMSLDLGNFGFFIIALVSGIFAFFGIKNSKYFKKPETLKDTNIFKTVKADYQFRELLKNTIEKRCEGQERLRHIPGVVVSSIGVVTNTTKPAELQILYSTDRQTEEIFAQPERMEDGLTSIHYRMMMKEASRYETFFPAELHSETTVAFYERERTFEGQQTTIKKSMVFSIGATLMELNGELKEAHVVLYLNFTTEKVLAHEDFLLCKQYVIRFRELITRGHSKKNLIT